MSPVVKSVKYLMYLSQNYSFSVLRPLQEQIRSRGGKVRWFLVGTAVDSRYLKKDEVPLPDVDAVIRWRPDVVFVPGNVVPAFIPGVKVQVFHGLNSGKVNRRGREYHFEIRGCFDLYCTHGPSTTIPFQRLAQRHRSFYVKETGWPALDPLFRRTGPSPWTKPGDDRPVILMCSTFSKRLSCAPMVFETVKELSKRGRWRWLIQFHPKMDPTVVALYRELEGDHLRFVRTDNIIPLLKTADVMLCDTSSVVQMFLLSEKPVVTVNNRLPGPHLINVTCPEQVEPAVEMALQRPPELMEAIRQYGLELHPERDGRSSRRVLEAVDEIMAKGITALKPKPLNLIRHYKMRKKMGYWRRVI